MSAIHPHWATEEGAVEVPVTTRTRTPVPAVPLSSVSRRPAAIAGIALVLTVGVTTLFQRGDLALPAQTVDAAVDIRITPAGFMPQAFAVSPGQSITWINEDSIPHILASTNLPTDGSTPLESPPIFPGQRFTVVIPDDAPENDYAYISRTSASLNGAVSVSALSAAAQDERDSPQQEQPLDIPVDDTPLNEDDWQAEPTAEPVREAPIRTGLPTNPYTVGTAAYRPGGAASSAMSRPALPAATVTAQTPPPAQYHRPTSQPSSGMSTWLLCIMGAYAVWVLSRSTSPIPSRVR